MMKLRKRTALAGVMIVTALSLPALAGTRDEVAALYHPEGIKSTAEAGAVTTDKKLSPAMRWFRLSNGRQVNLADWKVVLFMQGHCGYCQRFDPLLKGLSQRTGFSVLAYTIDGQGDEAYPEALPAPAEVMKTFFPNIPVATPTTFLVNVNTMEALPLLQGATDEAGFMSRMDTVLQMHTARAGSQ